MNNKTLILIGLFICLLFTLPMISAADINGDSNIIDDSVIDDNINSQSIATTDVNVVEDDGLNSISNANDVINSSAEDDNGIASIDAVSSERSDSQSHDEEIQSTGNGKKKNDRNVLGASPLGANGDGNTFSDLKILIDQAIASAQPLTLDRNFAFTPGEDDALIDGIVINSSIIINGNSNTIEGTELARIFIIRAANEIIEEIK